MPPVFVTDEKFFPCLERSGFTHSSYDEADVANNGFIVRVQYTPALSLVVTPHENSLGGKMVIIITCRFSNEG